MVLRAARLLYQDASPGAQLVGAHAPIAACVNSAPSCWIATRRPACGSTKLAVTGFAVSLSVGISSGI